MKTLARMTALLVVLGLCLPSYGSILVYKTVQNGSFFVEQQVGQWEVSKEVSKSFLVIDIDDANQITQAESISYRKDAAGKTFTQNPLVLELVRVVDGSRVRWVVMEKQVEFSGQAITSDTFFLLDGLARNREIGEEAKREVASKVSGFGLQDSGVAEGREIGKSTLSATLSPSMTVRANGTGVDQGNGDFDTTRELIKADLVAKGYVEQDM
jgi:hypothetical protein